MSKPNDSPAWLYDRLPRPIANTIVSASIVAPIACAGYGVIGLIHNGDPFSVFMSTPETVGNYLNVCDPPDDSKTQTIKAAIQRGRDNPRSDRQLLFGSLKPGDETLLSIKDTPSLDYAKSLLGEVTRQQYGIEMTYGDDSEDPAQIKKDVDEFAQVLLSTPPELLKGANIEAVELNSTDAVKGIEAEYRAYKNDIVIRSGQVSYAASHEIGHAIQSVYNDKHCLLPSGLNREFEAINPPEFNYGKENLEKLTEKQRREITLTDYGIEGGSHEDGAETLRIIQNTDEKSSLEQQCALGQAALTDEKIVISLRVIADVAGEDIGEAYAERLGRDGASQYCEGRR